MTSAPASASGLTPAKYTTGTLSYTKFGLFTLFSWLLWGDLCFSLMEGVGGIFPTFLLMKLHLTPMSATIMTSTIPQILGVFVGPAVSFKSDRTHSRFGRRIPYIIFTAPFLCLFLVGMGFSGQIADYISVSTIPAKLGISPMWAILIIIGLMTLGFTFFNEFVGSVYYYLFNDVVPSDLMGRFQSLFRIVGTGAGMFYKAFVFEYSLDYMQWVFLGGAIIYIIGISLMCWRVREGQYPPTTDVTEKTSIIDQIMLYFRECFTHPIYLATFLYSSFAAMAGAAGIGGTYFTLNLGLSMADIGHISAATAMASIIVSYPCGWLVDRFHPLRTMMISTVPLPFIQVGSYFFVHGYWSYICLQGTNIVVWGVITAASYPLLMNIFPRPKFGQFCSANAMVRAGAVVIGSIAAGPYLNWLTNSGKSVDNYRFSFLWAGFFYAASLTCLLVIFHYWKKLGGKDYQPPAAS